MAFLDIESFEDKRWEPQKVVVVVFILFILFVAVFLLFVVKPHKRGIITNSEIELTLHLKLSPNDIVGFFSESKTQKWINVRVLETKDRVYRAKLRHKTNSETDFQIDIENVVYNLFILGYKRREVLNFFKLAKQWGIQTTSPEIAEIKINGVLLGLYIMEPEVYEQIRDEKKNFYVSLGSNCYQLRKILHFVRNQDTKLLEKYFDLDKLASYFVYFSLFSFRQVLDFNQMGFLFESRNKIYSPFLTVKAVLSTLENYGLEFINHNEYNFLSYNELDKRNIKNLMDKIENCNHKELIKIVLENANKKL